MMIIRVKARNLGKKYAHKATIFETCFVLSCNVTSSESEINTDYKTFNTRRQADDV
jgi:hypothetical protein